MNYQPGNQLGPYLVVAPLGRGGIGEVYRARDTRLGREIALKVLAHGAAADPEHRRRFEQEAKAASSLNHPCVAQIYDVGIEDGVVYLAMELVEGHTLRQLLRDDQGAARALEVDRVLELSIQIARGVARAHERGVVHRDLKPENVMVTPEGWVKILDFGLAKLTSAWLQGSADAETIDHAPTRVGQLLGTAEYMSPEQAGGRAIDHRSDQFALGSMLYEMTSGQFAFRRETPVQTLAAILEREPLPLRDVAPGPLRSGFAAVVERCLRKQPADRYATTGELVAALEAVAGNPVDSPTRPVSTGTGSSLTEEALAILERTENTGGAIGDLVEAAFVVRDEIGQAIGFLPDKRYYFVQRRRGKSQRLLDRDLITKVRKVRVSGNEPVRRGDQSEWTRLADTELFRRDAPDHVKLTRLQRRNRIGWVAHGTAYAAGAVATAATALTGASILVGNATEFIVMALWSVGLATHTWFARRRQGVLLEATAVAQGAGQLPAAMPSTPSPPEPKRPPVAALLARVRERIDERGGDDVLAQRAELTRLEAVLAELSRRHQQLEAELADDEHASVLASEQRARAARDQATSETDRQLQDERLQTLRERLTAIDDARAERDRVAIRLQLAEHQVKQLLLDLTRNAAAAIDTPELSSRLQVIRTEADLADQSSSERRPR